MKLRTFVFLCTNYNNVHGMSNIKSLLDGLKLVYDLRK